MSPSISDYMNNKYQLEMEAFKINNKMAMNLRSELLQLNKDI